MRRLSPILWTFGAVVVAIMILIGITPTLLSTQWGNRFLLNQVSNSIPGTLTASKIYVSWFDGQSALGCELKDPNGKKVFQCQSLSVEASLWSLFWGSHDLGRIEVADPYLHLVINQDNGSNLHDSLARMHFPLQIDRCGPPIASHRTRNFYTGALVIFKGRIHTQLPGKSLAKLDDFHLLLVIPENLHDVVGRVSGKTSQDKLAGEFDFHFQGIRLIPNSNSLPILPTESFHTVTTIANFPVDIADALISLYNPAAATLLSALLGDQVDFSGEAKGSLRKSGTFNATLRGDKVEGLITGRADDGAAFLTEPARMTTVLTPELSDSLFPLLPRAQALRLESDTTLSLTIDSLKLQWSDDPIELTEVEAQASLAVANTQVSHPEIGSLSVNDTLATLFIESLKKPIELRAETTLVQADKSATLIATGQLNPSDQKGEFHAEVHGFPTRWFEPFVQKDFIIQEIVGDTLWASVRGTIFENQTTLSIGLRTETLEAGPLEVVIGKEIRSTKEASIALNLTPSAWGHLFNTDVTLAETTAIKLTSEQFKWPRSRHFDPSQSCFHGNIEIGPLKVANIPHQGEMTIHPLRVQLRGPSLGQGKAAGLAHIFFPEESGLIAAALGTSFPVTVEGEFSFSPTADISFPHLYFHLQSELLDLATELSVTPDHKLRLLAPAQIDYIVDQELINQLHPGPTDDLPQLVKPFPAEIKIAPFEIDLKNLEPAAWRVMGSISLSDAELTGPLQPTINTLSGHFALNNPDNTVTASFSGEASTKDQHGSKLTGGLKVSHFRTPKKASLTLKSTLDDLPVSVAELLLGTPHLTTLIGPYATVDVDAHFDQLLPLKGELSTLITTDLLHASTDLEINQQTCRAQPMRDTQITWTLTPAAFDLSQHYLTPGGVDLKLVEAAHLNITLKDLILPLASPTNLCCAGIDFLATASDMKLQDGAATVEVKGLEASIDASCFATAIDIKLQGQLISGSERSTAAEGEQGSFSINAHLTDHVTDDGELDIKGGTIFMQTTFEEVSVPWFCRLALGSSSLARQATYLIGPRLTADGHLSLSNGVGPAKLSMKSEHIAAEIDGKIADHAFTLTKPLTASIEATPTIAKNILNIINPLFGSISRTENPITLHIDPEGFSWPLWPFELQKLKIESGSFDLGKFWMKGGGALAPLLNLLKVKHDGELRGWATPLIFSVEEGTFTYKRIDLLIGKSLHLASWGSVDFENDKVRAVIALPSSTLDKLLNLTIPPNTYILIPARGKAAKAYIDWGKAAAQLALFAAGRPPSEKDIVPPPTTTPFPWVDQNGS